MRKDYLAFFISLFLSRLADQILLFLVPLVVFQTTQSASWAGVAFLSNRCHAFLHFRYVARFAINSRRSGSCISARFTGPCFAS